jgi:transcriptional regulator with XRE-family HTH domain
MSKVGRLIKEAREIEKVTQKQLAEKLGVSDMFVSRIEMGTSPLPPKYIKAVSQALSLTVSMVVGALRQDVIDKYDKRLSKHLEY